ncbi:lysozyme inhibitor LprI family protein [Pseudoduganella lutea]|nr:lysozyme inhibitor LprI family protein [Pseudoduganella lutea]
MLSIYQLAAVGLLFFSLASASMSAPQQCNDDCVLRNRIDAQDCKLDKTPLARCESYSEFIKIDERLNNEYRRLMNRISASQKKDLRAAQRNWIAFRDEQCEVEEVDAKCVHGMCSGVAHDSCILDLTLRRTKELRILSEDLQTAEKRGFSFSRDRTDQDIGEQQ